MAEKRTPNNGNCYQCGKTFGKTAMKNHVLKEHNTGEEESFLLKIESAYYKDYWLYIDIPKSKKIEYIDKFLRDIWLECCGHMSRFAASYNSHGNIGKTRTVGSFSAGDEIYYEYDMGTTTALYIKFIGEIKRPKQQNSVRLLARNIAPVLKCAVCGSSAEFICTECMYDPDESAGSLFCEKHSEQHKHDDMMPPLANSPRNGECGYTGEQDLYGFTGDIKRDRETSIGKIRRYERVFTGEQKNEIKDDKKFEIIKSDTGLKMKDAEDSIMGTMATMFEKLLSGDLDESDLTEDNLLEIFGGMKNQFITRGKPVLTLKEVYERKSIAALREIAEMEELKDYSKLKKSELIKLLAEHHISADELKSVFLIMTEQEFQLFCDNLEKDMFIADETIFHSMIPISARVFIVFDIGAGKSGEYFCVIPQEIKALYKELVENENILEKRQKAQNISKYARACVNLYGIIEIEKFTEIFNEYNSLNTSCDDMNEALSAFSMGNMQEYGVYNDYLIHGSLYDSPAPEVGSLVKHLSDYKKNKPYYIPSNEEFLKYAEPDYYEETAEAKAFKEHLRKNGFKDAAELEEVFLDIIWSIKNGLGKPLDFMRILNEAGFEFKSQNAAKKAVESAMAMYGNTRMWINNGYAPNEMGNLKR